VSSVGPKVPRAVRAAKPREDEASEGSEDAKRLPVDQKHPLVRLRLTRGTTPSPSATAQHRRSPRPFATLTASPFIRQESTLS